MSFNNFLEKTKGNSSKEISFEEAVIAWKKMSPSEKAVMIKEAQGDKEMSAYLLEVDKGCKELIKEETAVKEEQDTNEQESEHDNSNVAAGTIEAIGISSGLGAMNLAKKLRSAQSE